MICFMYLMYLFYPPPSFFLPPSHPPRRISCPIGAEEGTLSPSCRLVSGLGSNTIVLQAHPCNFTAWAMPWIYEHPVICIGDRKSFTENSCDLNCSIKRIHKHGAACKILNSSSYQNKHAREPCPSIVTK